MTIKKYTFLKLLIVMLISALTSYSISIQNYFLPIPIILGLAAFLYIIRSKVTDVMADERDYKIAGQAARYTLFVFSLLGVVLMFILLNLGINNNLYQILGNALASTVCLVMLINAGIFKWLNSRQ